jgi:hypothetical protein
MGKHPAAAPQHNLMAMAAVQCSSTSNPKAPFSCTQQASKQENKQTSKGKEQQ